MSLISLLTSRTWRDKHGKKHKATRVSKPDSIPMSAVVVRSSHSPEVCHCSTCQKIVREKFNFREVSFVDYVSQEIARG